MKKDISGRGMYDTLPDYDEPLSGVYFIVNAGQKHIALDIPEGYGGEASRVTGWTRRTGWRNREIDLYNQLWLVEKFQNEQDTYTLQNLRNGTFFDLEKGNADNGAKIIGSRYNSRPHQRWNIKRDSEGYYRIQNVETGTFVDNHNGGYRDGCNIYGWRGNWATREINQQYTFERASLTPQELRQMINPNYTGGYFEYHCSQVDGHYIVLSQKIWHEVWRESGLQNRTLRQQSFDSDDFALAYKTAFTKWAVDNIRADRVKALCGFMFGKPRSDSKYKKCYNFTLTDDGEQMLFFDPTDNRFQVETPNEEPVLGYF